MYIFASACSLFEELQGCCTRAGGHQCTPHTLIVDMVHHNNAIKLHEIQQKVIEDHVNFQYFHFYTECFSWIPWKDRMNIFSRMKLGSIGPKGEGEDGTGLAIGPLLHGGSICYVLPSLIMRFSTIMPAWPESMRCCGRARAGGASYAYHCAFHCTPIS